MELLAHPLEEPGVEEGLGVGVLGKLMCSDEIPRWRVNSTRPAISVALVSGGASGRTSRRGPGTGVNGTPPSAFG